MGVACKSLWEAEGRKEIDNWVNYLLTKKLLDAGCVFKLLTFLYICFLNKFLTKQSCSLVLSYSKNS